MNHEASTTTEARQGGSVLRLWEGDPQDEEWGGDSDSENRPIPFVRRAADLRVQVPGASRRMAHRPHAQVEVERLMSILDGWHRQEAVLVEMNLSEEEIDRHCLTYAVARMDEWRDERGIA